MSLKTQRKEMLTLSALMSGMFTLAACNGTPPAAQTADARSTASALLDSSSSSSEKNLFPKSSTGAPLDCLSETASIVGLSDTQIALSNHAHISGNLVLFGSSRLSMSNNAQVLQSVIATSRNQISFANHSGAQRIVEADLSGSEVEITKFTDRLNSLNTTESIAAGSGSMANRTINGNGRLNVIDINGNLNLSTNKKWTLSGTNHDLFVLRVRGNLNFEQTGSLKLAGGVLAKNVLIYLPGSNASVNLSNNTEASGTFLVPQGTVVLHNSALVKGAIVARYSILIDNNVGTFEAAPFCPVAWEGYADPTPTPAATPSPTATPCATATPAPSATPVPTATPAPSATPVPTATPAPSATPVPTATPSGTPDPNGSPNPDGSPNPYGI